MVSLNDITSIMDTSTMRPCACLMKCSPIYIENGRGERDYCDVMVSPSVHSTNKRKETIHPSIHSEEHVMPSPHAHVCNRADIAMFDVPISLFLPFITAIGRGGDGEYERASLIIPYILRNHPSRPPLWCPHLCQFPNRHCPSHRSS